MPNDPLSLTSHPQLLLVLNGPRGVGKRTVAAAVARHLRGATVFDPDAVGAPDPVGIPHTAGAPGIHAGAADDEHRSPKTNHRTPDPARTSVTADHLTPTDKHMRTNHHAGPTNDLEHRAPARWRVLVADAAEALRRRRPGPILMPATLLDRTHCEHLLDLLVARGFDVRHVTLHLDHRDRRARIGDDEATASGRAARRARLGHERRYERARPWLHTATLVVDTTAGSPDTIAVGLAEAALNGSLPVHRPGADRPDSAPTRIDRPAPAGVYRAGVRNPPLRVGRTPDGRRRKG
ncbi:AAA family ATPase [Embleya sp. MST-111070]|uniref:AAA family ATPase n=1 Tax=Embleya sp. MST-111070 TaxID=3398231 RepID=UPI003F734168